jgi:uncharacterized protein YgbK (DUF1537 family)
MSGTAARLPDGPLVSWYGDDFTGAAAVMEVLSLAGLPAVLFCALPTPALLVRFAGFRGLGIAGVARSKDPQWMERELPPVFEALAKMQAPVTHYKVCSTLDSTPHVGSIGKAIDLAMARLPSAWVPLLLAAPALQRYQLFANLFAIADGVGYRLDRHPTMSRHPITPMTESDVRRHLGAQTEQSIGLVDLLALREGRAVEQLRAELASGNSVIAIDVLDEASLTSAGELLWGNRGNQLFTVGSQGIEYALVAYWKSVGLIDNDPPTLRASAVERLAVASGSCSPMTAQQIDWAEAHGFEPIRLNVRASLEETQWARTLAEVTQAALRAIGEGRDPLVYTAHGPDDPAIAALWDAADIHGQERQFVNARIGRGLGTVLAQVCQGAGLRRGVLAGGDTSGYGVDVLGLQALTLLASTVPGGGLFRAHSENACTDGFEIALKGGQMGAADYFGQIKRGGGAARY